VESHDDFPGVEISITRGVGDMVRVSISISVRFNIDWSLMGCRFWALDFRQE